jgi:SAM-dependent methyltransferase
MNQDPFYKDGKLYDVVTRDMTAKDQGFFLKRAAESGGPVLEVACGTGRITIPVAQHGVKITGLDLSPGMLSEARIKAKDAGVLIEWLEADCRSFALPTKFSLIFIAYNSLLHLHDRVSLERFLYSVSSHLLPDGKFVFAIFNPGIHFMAKYSGHRREVGTFTDPYSGKSTLVEELLEYDAENQINRTTWFYSVGDERDVQVHHLHLRCYYPQELDALLHYNGFDVLEKLGNYDGTPFSSKSPLQIVTCGLHK